MDASYPYCGECRPDQYFRRIARIGHQATHKPKKEEKKYGFKYEKTPFGRGGFFAQEGARFFSSAVAAGHLFLSLGLSHAQIVRPIEKIAQSSELKNA